MPVQERENTIHVGDLKDRVTATYKKLYAQEKATAAEQERLGVDFTSQMDIIARKHHAALAVDASNAAQLYVQGETLQEKLRTKLTFASDVLDVVEQPGVKEDIHDGILWVTMVPEFALPDKRLDEIAAGKDDPYTHIFPTNYLKGISEQKLPLPVREPYTVLADTLPDAMHPTTRLSRLSSLSNPSHASIGAVRTHLQEKGSQAVEQLGFDPDNVSIKPISFREEALFRATRHVEDERVIVTNTRVRGDGAERVLFTGRSDLSFHPENQNTIPTRLTVVTRPLVKDVYRTGNRR